MMSLFEYFDWETNVYGKAVDSMPDWRLGQAFYVEFDKTGKEFPELFYEMDKDKARDIIFEYYGIG